MTRKHERPDIDIKRNPVERFLMRSKDYILKNRTFVIAGSIFVLLSVVILVVSVVIFDRTTGNQRAELEKLNEKFQNYVRENRIENARGVIPEIISLADSSLFGFANRMGYYYAGNYYYILGDYEEARETLKSFVKRAEKNVFWELAYFKVGVIYEDAGELEKALEVYREIARNYRHGVMLDQLYFYTGNVYSGLKDYNNAEFYYNRVINDFSGSPYADKARQRIFLLGSG